MSALSGHVSELERELGSGRDPSSIRGRLHIAENDRTAAEAARAALDAAKRDRAAAEAARNERSDRRWTKRQLLLGLVVALPTALPTVAGAWLMLLHQLSGQ